MNHQNQVLTAVTPAPADLSERSPVVLRMICNQASNSMEFVEMMIGALVRDFQSGPFSSGSVIRFIRHLRD